MAPFQAIPPPRRNAPQEIVPRSRRNAQRLKDPRTVFDAVWGNPSGYHDATPDRSPGRVRRAPAEGWDLGRVALVPQYDHAKWN